MPLRKPKHHRLYPPTIKNKTFEIKIIFSPYVGIPIIVPHLKEIICVGDYQQIINRCAPYEINPIHHISLILQKDERNVQFMSISNLRQIKKHKSCSLLILIVVVCSNLPTQNFVGMVPQAFFNV